MTLLGLSGKSASCSARVAVVAFDRHVFSCGMCPHLLPMAAGSSGTYSQKRPFTSNIHVMSITRMRSKA
jgi:hypothetical protein